MSSESEKSIKEHNSRGLALHHAMHLANIKATDNGKEVSAKETVADAQMFYDFLMDRNNPNKAVSVTNIANIKAAAGLKPERDYTNG